MLHYVIIHSTKGVPGDPNASARIAKCEVRRGELAPNVFLRFELIDAVRFRAAERLRSGLVWSGHVFDRRVEIKHFLDFDDVFGILIL